MKSSSLVCIAFVIFLLVELSSSEATKEKDSTVAYVKASLPNQIFRCIQKFNLLRCLKYFVLLRLESRDYHIPETESSTSEFLGNILKSEKNLPLDIPDHFMSLDDEELNERLTVGFQKFFKTRPIMLRFIPNMLVKIVPSKSKDLEFSLKKFEKEDFTSRNAKDVKEKKDSKDSDESKESVEEDEEEEAVKVESEDETKDEEGVHKSGVRRKNHYLQFGVPLVLAPAMIFAGFLPMIIPVLKLATAFVTIVNTFALAAAVLYLARQHALEREMQQTVYFNPGYKDHQ